MSATTHHKPGPVAFGLLLCSRVAACAAVGLLAATAQTTVSSATERNLPAVESGVRSQLAPPNAVPGEVSNEPLGQNLSAVVFLGPTDAVVAAGPGVSVDASRVPLLDDPGFASRVARFIGQPLSQRLIADIQAEVALFFRDAGFPFVSVSTPPQEITAGHLRIRVVEFRAGAISVEGNSRITDSRVLDRVRLQTGDKVESEVLSEDLDWLNRSPFRRITAQFSPGGELGVTDLALRVDESKPWNVFGGYSNLGDTENGTDRYFLGATVGDVLVPGSVMAGQLTVSPDFWYDGGSVFGNTDDADYVSVALRSVVPLWPRAQLEIVVNGLETNEQLRINNAVFSVQTTTLEGTLGVRSSASDLLSIPGDVVVGIEARRQERDQFFGGFQFDAADIEIYQVFLGWNWNWTDGDTSLSADLIAHGSPGGLTGANSDQAFADYTGRVTDATYAYAYMDVQALHTTDQEFGLFTQLLGQTSTGPLPETEQVALGGGATVRGYSSDDGNYDRFVVSRNELRLPPTKPLPVSGPAALTVVPFLFSDVGFAANANADGETAVSAGVGARGVVGNVLTANASLAAALSDAPVTKAGDWRLDFVMTVKY